MTYVGLLKIRRSIYCGIALLQQQTSHLFIKLLKEKEIESLGKTRGRGIIVVMALCTYTTN